MTREADGAPTHALGHVRQVTIDRLCEHFANDALTVEEFERRIDRAHAAGSAEALDELLRDLPGGNLPAVPDQGTRPARQPDYSVTSYDQVEERSFAVAVLGGSRRVGRWTPARENYAIAVMGGAELDFREAVMGPGVTELRVFTLCGGVDVIVPPGMHVESHGIGILGGFDHRADHHAEPDPSAPTLRITGVALLGGVDVNVRYAGESSRDARRRRKAERREKAREIREAARDARRRLRP